MVNILVQAVSPTSPLIQRTRALFDLVRGAKGVPSRFEALSTFLARLVTMDLGGDNDVSDLNIFYTASDPDKEGNSRSKVTNGALPDRRCGGIPRTDLGDSNIPVLKAATIEDRPFDNFFVPIGQVTKHRSRLAIERGQDDCGVRSRWWRRHDQSSSLIGRELSFFPHALE
jgi:hypothetical protein